MCVKVKIYCYLTVSCICYRHYIKLRYGIEYLNYSIEYIRARVCVCVSPTKREIRHCIEYLALYITHTHTYMFLYER